MKIEIIVSCFFLLTSHLVDAQQIDSVALANQIKSLIKESKKLSNSGDFETALQRQAEAEKIAFEVFGKENESIPNLIYNRANIQFSKGDYRESEKSFLEALSLQENITGQDDELYIGMLNNLAFLYLNTGQYKQAEDANKRVLKLLENKDATFDGMYAESLNNLSLVYLITGAYELAEPLCVEVISRKEKSMGKNDPSYCGSLINLGYLYLQLAKYEQGEMLLLQAKDIFENTIMDKEHPFYINCIGNLASLYTDVGDYDKSEYYWKATMKGFEKIVGKTHPEYARALSGLSLLYLDQGKYNEAEELLQDALVIRDTTFGRKHREYAEALGFLGDLYTHKKDFEKAEDHLSKAKVIIEEALGKSHIDYANVNFRLGNLYYAQGNWNKAESSYLEAGNTYQLINGKDNAWYAAILFQLGLSYIQSRQPEKAETAFQEAVELTRHELTRSMYHMSEQELNNYLSTFSNRQNQILSYTLASNSTIGAQLCYDNSLYYKGFLLNAIQQIKRLAMSSPETARQYLVLKGKERRLAEIYSMPIIERDSNQVATLKQEINSIEKELARAVNGMNENQTQIYWKDVRQSLKVGEAAIEFVHFDYYENEKTGQKIYAAIVIQPGMETPGLIRLFEERSLDSLLVLHQERRSDYVNDLYAFEERGAAAVNRPRRTLYELIWSPLEKELKDVSTVYFSPAGLLHRINLAAIPVNEDQSLGEMFHLIQLNSTRQLVLPSSSQQNANMAILYGGIQYEVDSLFMAAHSNLVTDHLASRGNLVPGELENLRGGTWNYLRWTQKEVESIADALGSNQIDVKLLTAQYATEDSFKDMGNTPPSPRIVHIATHGFFFPDPVKHDLTLTSDEPVFKMSDHPMIRSGLIMAGGNNAWNGKPSLAGMEDGILTAMEISQLDLSNTELVVLSACETGLGDIQGNEGVYGLQRAFRIAGVKYLIMSLWQVPDRETSQFMTAFYRHWLEDKLSIRDAFRKTQLEMKERFFNPYQWAGFVLVE